MPFSVRHKDHRKSTGVKAACKLLMKFLTSASGSGSIEP